MKQFFCAAILTALLGISDTLAQNKFTINGYVKDAENGEELIGATVIVKELETGTITNVYGFYAITLESGEYTLQYSYLGYEVVEKTFKLNTNIDSNN